MITLECARCGQPLGSATEPPDEMRPPFCSLGCVVRAKVPVDKEGNFPVNRTLGVALAVGFLMFNQLLCWSLVAMAERRDRLSLAHDFERAELITAIFLFVAIVTLQLLYRTQRAKEWLLTAVCLALLAKGISTVPLSGPLLAAANGVILIWSGRGIFQSSARAYS